MPLKLFSCSLLRIFTQKLQPYLTTNYLKSAHFFREFVIHVENENHMLELLFSPSTNGFDAYAFANQIEIVSMPPGLYNNNVLMETMYRFNVGRQSIPPNQDIGMSLCWTVDWSYIFGAAFGIEDYGLNVPIKYTSDVPACAAS